jgi:hypothetical protein
MTGTIAIDAFAVGAPLVPPLPTVETTSQPPVNPTETALPVPPTALPTSTPLPVTLPFIDTFDSGQGWNPAGAWRFDTGHQGMGWFSESTQRAQTSTLTYGAPVDLRGAMYPQLSFWQKAVLTGSESLAVEISVDGGLSWFLVDQQVGLISDWTQHTVDLSAYRGAIISLRFTLSTFGLVPDGVITVGYWFDELAIQDVPATPTATPFPTELPTVVPTEVPPVPTDIPTAVPTEIPIEPTPIPTEVERTTS